MSLAIVFIMIQVIQHAQMPEDLLTKLTY